ncbi:uncharacterized protein BO87DRAFT_384712 [Aspergillus neoniger CBS 115656]|uniref:NAD(P)-binding protein n=1 Tax=Aspergillus neoniger (strain CBS 115656) TaxID=1448310 RepID=A0A318YPK1_ASPNB|nr:hypothetical protein BO87DRAFT_384712 [Aspergillus neoniger CBS 115656]PYH36254.1 hypothetical protein BO87DRAFT_384712 [Aspergillus neoniger CBS 115656]
MTVMKPLTSITGANRTGRYRLLIGARTQEKAEEAIKKLGNSSNNFAPVILDLNSDVSIKAAAAFIQARFGSLNILVNNGGVNQSSDPNATLRETYRAVFETTSLGWLFETALNMIKAVDAVRLQKENILSIVVCPGHCRTEFEGGNGVKSPEEGAQPIVRAATKGPPEELFGKVVEDEGYFVEFGW